MLINTFHMPYAASGLRIGQEVISDSTERAKSARIKRYGCFSSYKYNYDYCYLTQNRFIDIGYLFYWIK